MANYCSNSVSFTGSEENVNATKSMFHELEEKQRQDQTFYLPEYVSAERSYMLGICVTEDNIIFETMWVPNIEALQQIADYHKVGFVVEYGECGHMASGRVTYENGKLTEVYLDPDDFISPEYNEEEKTFTYEDEIYAREEKILELLLKEKSGLNSEDLSRTNVAVNQPVLRR